MIRHAALTTGAVVAGLLLGVPAAHATFPGRDGTIAVQPLSGPGVLLVGPGGGRDRRLCPTDLPCGPATAPSWSVDGRTVAFGLRTRHGGVEAVYPDGTCFTCVGGPGRPLAAGAAGAVFGAQPFQLTQVTADDLSGTGIDPGPPAPRIGGADWSSSGRLALTVDGELYVGVPGHLGDEGRGGPPSWSPDGRRLAYVRDGWVVTSRPGGPARRLTRGSAPVYSPDGRRVAFFDAGHRLETIAVGGGRTRRIGRIRGARAAWQARPRPPRPSDAPCAAQSGQSLVAATTRAAITRLPDPADPLQGSVIGCTAASGEPRLLGSYGVDHGQPSVGAAALSSGSSVASVAEDLYAYDTGDGATTIATVDLTSGRAPAGAPRPVLGAPLHQLAVDDAGSVAAIADGNACHQPFSSQCVLAADARGTAVLAAADAAGGSTPFGDLTLSGGVVGWTQDGVAHSAPLP